MADNPIKPAENRREDGTFGPGNVANPNGRPKKGHSITEMIKQMLDDKPELKQAVGNKIMQMVLSGDITTIRTLWNYMDGMPMQHTDVTTLGEKLEAPHITIDTHEKG